MCFCSQISQDGTKIRRSQEKPLPDNRIEYWQQFKQRTIYVVNQRTANKFLNRFIRFFLFS